MGPLPIRVEDWTEAHRAAVLEAVHRAAPDAVDVFVIGSRVYGRDDVRDVDVLVFLDPFPEDRDDRLRLRTRIRACLADAGLTDWFDPFLSSPHAQPLVATNGCEIPAFCLTTGVLFGKAPGETIDGRFWRTPGPDPAAAAFEWRADKPARLPLGDVLYV